MIVLGFIGGRDRIDDRYEATSMSFAHDSAAVLLRDGEVVAAFEEERLNRIKHSNKFPTNALRRCVESAGIGWKDVDQVVYAWREDCLDREQQHTYLTRRHPRPFQRIRDFYQSRFQEDFGVDISGKLSFVEHHVAHAHSAFAYSGFDQCIVLTLDGCGDLGAGQVGRFDGKSFRIDQRIPQSNSLGWLYMYLCGVIGYKQFDEYKVMGLAPYGDPKRYESVFASLYRLLPEGGFRIHEALRWFGAAPREGDPAMAVMRVLPELQRGKNDPFEQKHCDWAAGLQQMLETIVFHVAEFHARRGEISNLAVAGGVAHNCTANGKLLRSGLFKDVFVQPAAHDPGAALGAALAYEWQSDPNKKRTPKRMTKMYWGTDVGSADSIESELRAWGSVVEYRRSSDVCSEAAELLAKDRVIGWVQGRAEFGPRALGNRSILADPRPAANKDRINEMVKKREGYRPFAPSVAVEAADEYFVCSGKQGSGPDHPFMIFVLEVRPDKRELLGAVTHVDGTARVQTVAQDQNDKYWRLITEFGRRTGVPVVLNTSFNNNAEPIVDTVRDALTCFVTTQIDVLVVGDFVVTKKREASSWEAYRDFSVRFAPYQRLVQSRGPDGKSYYQVSSTFDQTVFWRLSEEAGRVLVEAEYPIKLGDLCRGSATLGPEMFALWAERGVVLTPPT